MVERELIKSSGSLMATDFMTLAIKYYHDSVKPCCLMILVAVYPNVFLASIRKDF